MPSSLFLALRRMRAPLIALVLIYAVSIAGLVAIPGVDEHGRPFRMDFLHAFYFVSYTATTIGFGEIPRPFTPAQRLWVTFCIYLTVIGWSYAFYKLLSLTQDQWFQQAVKAQHFSHQVQRMTEPFVLVCGYGDAGTLLCRALDELGRRFVVLDPNPARTAEVDVAGYRFDVPALAADARQPEILINAGLMHRACTAILALTPSDRVNLSIAFAAHLLRPKLMVICRADSPETGDEMTQFGAVATINPYRTFAEYLKLAIQSPGSYQLQQWLTGMPGTSLGRQTEPPSGPWAVFGDGSFAVAVIEGLRDGGLAVESISAQKSRDSHLAPTLPAGILPDDSHTPSERLRRADIRSAAGLVAADEDDITNLSVVLAARQINPDIFIVVRQNRQSNRSLFKACRFDIAVRSSEIIVHECLAHLTTPALARFMELVSQRDDAWADDTLLKLRNRVSREVPELWTTEISGNEAPAAIELLSRVQAHLRIDHLIRNPDNRDSFLDCVALLIIRADHSEILMPHPEIPMMVGDRILFAGTPAARVQQTVSLTNANSLRYVYEGRRIPANWLMRRLMGS